MKLLEPRIVKIGENTFYIRPLPAFRAAGLTAELTALLGPVVTPFLNLLSLANAESGKNALDMELDFGKLTPELSKAFASLDPDKVEMILKHLIIRGENISFSSPDSKENILLTEDAANELFCLDVQEMYKLAYEVIKTNYTGFFKKLKTRFGKVTRLWTKMKTAMEKTETLTDMDDLPETDSAN